MLLLKASLRQSKLSGSALEPILIRSRLSFQCLNGLKDGTTVAEDTLLWDKTIFKTQPSLIQRPHLCGRSIPWN
jgi:hypothetical protein